MYPVYLNLTNPLDLNIFTDDMRPLFYDAYARFGMDRARADAHIDELLPGKREVEKSVNERKKGEKHSKT